MYEITEIEKIRSDSGSSIDESILKCKKLLIEKEQIEMILVFNGIELTVNRYSLAEDIIRIYYLKRELNERTCNNT